MEFEHTEVVPYGDFRGQQVVLLLDTTYWGRNFGVVIIKDNISGRVLWHKYICRKEHLADYEEGVRYIQDKGAKILGIVSDGLKGLRNTFPNYRFQLCQFHMAQYVRIKLTNHPKSQAAIELLDIVNQIFHTDKSSFIGMLNAWEHRWSTYLNERGEQDKNGKKLFKHQRLRSAWRSMKRNMELLWTYYDHPEAKLPNTNNALEGLNSAIKDKMRRHKGISIERRKVLISTILKEHKPKR